jgi:transposase
MSELVPIIEENTNKDSVIYSDGWKAYGGLADFGYKRHYRVKQGQNEFVNGNSHINGIENFWGICKVRLTRYRGIHKHKFYLHLKECEFRFNHRNENLYLLLLKLIKNNPLN